MPAPTLKGKGLFIRFETPIPSEYGVRVNTFKDLKADKLLAYYGRAEPRDAVDLYFLLQKERVDSMLALAAQKDPGFDLILFCRGPEPGYAVPR